MIALNYPQVEATEADIWPWLYTQLSDDIAFNLAYANLLIDPFWVEVKKHGDHWEDEPIASGLHTARQHLPDEYVQMTALYWQQSEREFSHHLNDCMGKHSPGADVWFEPEEYNYHWLPYEGVGINLDTIAIGDGEYYLDSIRDLFPLFEALEIDYVEKGWHEGFQDRGDWRARHAAAQDIAQDLAAQNNVYLDNVAMLLHWLWIGTGNSLFDYTSMEIQEWNYEIQWDQLEFAWQVQTEAYDFLEEAFKGLAVLRDDFVVFNALIANMSTRYRYLKTRLEEDPEETIHDDTTINWPTPCLAGDSGLTNTQTNAHILRFWRYCPQAEHVILRQTD